MDINTRTIHFSSKNEMENFFNSEIAKWQSYETEGEERGDQPDLERVCGCAVSSQESDGGGGGDGGGSGGGHHHSYLPSASSCSGSVQHAKQDNGITSWNVLFWQCFRKILALGVFQESFFFDLKDLKSKSRQLAHKEKERELRNKVCEHILCFSFHTHRMTWRSQKSKWGWMRCLKGKRYSVLINILF